MVNNNRSLNLRLHSIDVCRPMNIHLYLAVQFLISIHWTHFAPLERKLIEF